MDALIHTLLAIACMWGCWTWGRYFSTDVIVKDMLLVLERDGFIKTEIDENGDKCLVKIDHNG